MSLGSKVDGSNAHKHGTKHVAVRGDIDRVVAPTAWM